MRAKPRGGAGSSIFLFVCSLTVQGVGLLLLLQLLISSYKNEITTLTGCQCIRSPF